jgi:D-threo-aldose 1-dehydrogenase
LATGPKPGAFYNYNPAPPEILDRVARIEAVCKRHGVRLIEAALNFPLAHPAVMSLILGSQSAAEALANLAIYETVMPPALWSELKAEGLMRADAPTA